MLRRVAFSNLSSSKAFWGAGNERGLLAAGMPLILEQQNIATSWVATREALKATIYMGKRSSSCLSAYIKWMASFPRSVAFHLCSLTENYPGSQILRSKWKGRSIKYFSCFSLKMSFLVSLQPIPYGKQLFTLYSVNTWNFASLRLASNQVKFTCSCTGRNWTAELKKY